MSLKLFANELAVVGEPIPPRIFNVTIYNNLSLDYNEVVLTLFIKRMIVQFDKLVEVLSNREIWLKMSAISGSIRQRHRHFYSIAFTDCDHSLDEYHGLGLPECGRGRQLPQPRCNPCLVCGILGYNPYKCDYKVKV